MPDKKDPLGILADDKSVEKKDPLGILEEDTEKKKSTTDPTQKVSSPSFEQPKPKSILDDPDSTSKSDDGSSEPLVKLKPSVPEVKPPITAPLTAPKGMYDYTFPTGPKLSKFNNHQDEFLSNEIDPVKKHQEEVFKKIMDKEYVLSGSTPEDQQSREAVNEWNKKSPEEQKNIIDKQKVQDEYNAGVTKSSIKTQIGKLTAEYDSLPVGKQRDVLKEHISKLTDSLNSITDVERMDSDNTLKGFSKDITDKYHDKILKYYSDLKVKNYEGFKNTITKIENGNFTQEDQNQVLNSILAHDANTSANDLRIMSARGYDAIFQETMDLKQGLDKAQEEVNALDDNDPRKAEGVAHIQEMATHLQSLVTEHGDKIQAFGQTLSNTQKTYQENTDLVKNYFPEIKAKQDKEMQDQLDNAEWNLAHPELAQVFESGKKVWNAALNGLESVAGFTKYARKVVTDIGGGDSSQDDVSDSFYRGVTGFLDNYKMVTDNRPVFGKDKDGKSVTNYDQILPNVAELAANIWLMLQGGVASADLMAIKSPELANKVGLFTSSFVQSVDGYMKSANEKGLYGSDAYGYATTAAGLNSALFMFDIFPKNMLGVQWNTSEGKLLQDATNKIMDGKGADAMKLLKDIAGANIIGQMQHLSDGLVGFVANNKFNLKGENKFQVLPDWDQMKETALMMTAISLISHGGTNIIGGKGLYDHALITLGKDIPKTEGFLVDQVKDGKMTQEQSQYILDLARGAEQGSKKMPVDMTDYKKSVVLPIIAEKEKLIEENKTLDPVFQEKNNAKIEELDNQIKDIVGIPKEKVVEPKPKTDEKVKEEKVGEETGNKEEGVLTPEELSALPADDQDLYHASVELGETDVVKELSDKAKSLNKEDVVIPSTEERSVPVEEQTPAQIKDNVIESNLEHGDKVTVKIFGKNEEGTVTGFGKKKGQIVVDFVDGKGQPRFAYAHQIENVEKGQKSLPEGDNFTDEQRVLHKELVDKIIRGEDMSAEDMNSLDELEKVKKGQHLSTKEKTDAGKEENIQQVDQPLPEAKDEKTSVEKIRAKQDAAKKRASEIINKIKELNKGKRFEGDQDVVSLGPDSDKLFGALEKLTHKFIDAGADVAIAIDRAHSALKKTKLYQSAINTADTKKEFDERVNQMVNDSKKEPVKKTKREKKSEKFKKSRKEIKSIASNVVADSKGSEKAKKLIKEKGLTYNRFTNEESKMIADDIILTQGLDKALLMAQDNTNWIKNAVRVQLFSGAINTYFNLEQATKDEGEKQHYAESQAALVEQLDNYARDYGQGVQAVSHFYKISPLGIVAREKQRIKSINEGEFEKSKRGDKIRKVQSEFKKIEDDASKLSDEEIKKRVEAGVVEELEKYGKKMYGQETFKKIDDALARFQAKLKGMAFESTLGLPVAAIDFSVATIRKALHAGFIIGDAIKHTIDEIKKKYKDPFDEEMFSKFAEEEFKDVKVRREKKFSPDTEEYIKSEKLKVLNKIFPKKPLEKSKNREEVHEKIVKSMDAGALDNEEFKKLFYEKFGLVDTSSPEVDKKLKEFAEDIHKAPEGSFLRNAEYTKMLNYMGNLKKESLVKLGIPVFYANILSSYETHIRNMQFNLPTVWVDKMGLLAQKKFIGKGGLGPVEYYQLLMKGYQRGKIEAGAVVKGETSAYDKAEMNNILDRVEKKGIAALFKYHVYPGRLLRAADVLNVVPLSEIKQYELARMEANKQNDALPEGQRKSQHQIDADVNEVMGYTSERLADANKKAEADIKKIYGDKFDLKNKKQFRDYMRRSFEIMEQSRPAYIVEEGINWAKKSLLTNKPEGTLGLVSDLLIDLNKRSLFPQLFIPFVNVPLNIANRMIYNTPYGAIKAFYGDRFGTGAKFGYGEGKRARYMTDDEKTEVYLKSINWTTQVAGLIALGMIKHKDENGKEVPELEVTGNITGDYTKNQSIFKATGKEPYSIYVNGEKIFTYQYTPWAPIFAPVGYYSDSQKYEEKQSMTASVANNAIKYFNYISDQSSMKGLGDFMQIFKTDSRQKFDPVNYAKTFLAKTASSLLVPNLVKATNNDIRGLFSMDDKRAIDTWQYLVKDMPFVEEILHTKYDHLGRPVKDIFDIPAVDVPGYDILKNTNDPYYKSFVDHNYYPNYFMDRNYTDLKFDKDGNVDIENSKEVQMTKSQLDDVNQVRGEYVLKQLEDKSFFNSLEKMDNDEYKKTMQKLFSEGTNYAKLKILLGMNDKDIEEGNDSEQITSPAKYKKMLEEK